MQVLSLQSKTAKVKETTPLSWSTISNVCHNTTTT